MDTSDILKTAYDIAKEPNYFDNNTKIDEILKTHSLIGGTLALIPLPGAMIPFVLANVYSMYYRINEVVGVPLNDNLVKSIGGMIASNITSVVGLIAGCELIKLIPIVGHFSASSVESLLLFSITGVQGKLYCEWLHLFLSSGGLDKNGNINNSIAKSKIEEILSNKNKIEKMIKEGKTAAQNIDFTKYKSEATNFVSSQNQNQSLKNIDNLSNFFEKDNNYINQPFLLPVEDWFTITGMGTVVTGRVERGVIKVGDYVEIVGFKDTKLDIVTAVEAYKKLLDEAKPGDNVGIMLKYMNKSDVERGIVLAKPGTISPHRKFLARVYILTKEQSKYNLEVNLPNGSNIYFYFRTTDVYGKINLQQEQKEIKFGEHMVIVELSEKIALEIGTRFAVRIKDGENDIGKTIGGGYITEIIE